MCIKVIERHSSCRCISHSHQVVPCPAYGRRGHELEVKEILVDYACLRHLGFVGKIDPPVLFPQVLDPPIFDNDGASSVGFEAGYSSSIIERFSPGSAGELSETSFNPTGPPPAKFIINNKLLFKAAEFVESFAEILFTYNRSWAVPAVCTCPMYRFLAELLRLLERYANELDVCYWRYSQHIQRYKYELAFAFARMCRLQVTSRCQFPYIQAASEEASVVNELKDFTTAKWGLEPLHEPLTSQTSDSLLFTSSAFQRFCSNLKEETYYKTGGIMQKIHNKVENIAQTSNFTEVEIIIPGWDII